MKLGTKVCLGLALLAAGLARTASAGVVFGFNQITSNAAPAVASQFSVEVSDGGPIGGYNTALFRFTNSGAIASSITEIYFQDGTLLSFQSLASQTLWNPLTNTGVQYGPDTSRNPHLPGDPTFTKRTTIREEGFWNSEDANNPSPFKGINPGEFLELRFMLVAGFDWNDTVAAMIYDVWPGAGEGKLRIGLHVQSIDNGNSNSFVGEHFDNPVPLPAEATMAGIGMMGMVGIRSVRRRRA